MNWKYIVEYTPYEFDDGLLEFMKRSMNCCVLLSDHELICWFIKNGPNVCVHQVIVNEFWKDRDES